MQAHIFLNGLVGAPSDFFSMEPFFTVEDVQREIDMNAGASTLVVHITSNGGYVNDAFAIHDKLANCGKTINTIGEGLVASAATIILLAGKKRQLTKYGELMIHNPFGSVQGDAEELQSAADEMSRIQSKIAQFYSDKIGKPASQFEKWMDQEKSMSSEEAMELGFITDILEPVRAVAIITTKNSQSSNSSIMSFLNEIRSEWKSLKNQILGTKNLDLTTADGRTFKVDTDKGEPEVENAVTIDGASASDGDYIIPALNKVIVVNSGKISEIKDNAGADENTAGAAAENTDTPEIKALKDEILARDQKISELTNKVTEGEVVMKEMVADIKMIKSNISSNYVPKGREQQFKKKEELPKNSFKEAAEKRQAERDNKASTN